MTSKERMMCALTKGKPDRLPVTIHQWQDYHLKEYMGGCDQLEAYIKTGLDASVALFWGREEPSPNWVVTSQTLPPDSRGAIETKFRVHTPDGDLTFARAQDRTTTFFTEHICKSLEEADLFLKHWPRQTHDHRGSIEWYDRTGDHGILRGFISAFGQAGPWQDFVEMVGTQAAIFYAMDEPEWVHAILQKLCDIKVKYVHEQLKGAPYDLIETGGGAGSSTVISPSMFREFCVPYDRAIHDALHDVGFLVAYHTCGGMMAILDDIPENHCDASETLSPPGMGGDIGLEDRMAVKDRLGSKVSLIGGLDQFNILTEKGPKEIKEDVENLFQTFGHDGGYICSASDHFFETPVENLLALAEAGRECQY